MTWQFPWKCNSASLPTTANPFHCLACHSPITLMRMVTLYLMFFPGGFLFEIEMFSKIINCHEKHRSDRRKRRDFFSIRNNLKRTQILCVIKTKGEIIFSNSCVFHRQACMNSWWRSHLMDMHFIKRGKHNKWNNCTFHDLDNISRHSKKWNLMLRIIVFWQHGNIRYYRALRVKHVFSINRNRDVGDLYFRVSLLDF